MTLEIEVYPPVNGNQYVMLGGRLDTLSHAQLDEALDHDPQVINLSAGCRPHHDLPSLAFQLFYDTCLKYRARVLFAAAVTDSAGSQYGDVDCADYLRH